VSKPSTYTNTWLIQFLYNNTTIGTVATNSTTNPTGVVYGTTSDLRLKENIRPTAKGLNDVMRIQVSDFNFKSKPGSTETGFIAQQLYTVLPEVVTQGGTDPSKDPWTVDYGRVTPLLTRGTVKRCLACEAVVKRARPLVDALPRAVRCRYLSTWRSTLEDVVLRNREAFESSIGAIQNVDKQRCAKPIGPAPHGLASEAALHAFALTHPLPLLNRHEFSPDRLTYILA
jgi:Chaperone of endosialidase